MLKFVPGPARTRKLTFGQKENIIAVGVEDGIENVGKGEDCTPRNTWVI